MNTFALDFWSAFMLYHSFMVQIFIVGDMALLVSFCRKQNRRWGYHLLSPDITQSPKEPRELWSIIAGSPFSLGVLFLKFFWAKHWEPFVLDSLTKVVYLDVWKREIISPCIRAGRQVRCTVHIKDGLFPHSGSSLVTHSVSGHKVGSSCLTLVELGAGLGATADMPVPRLPAVL